MNDADSIAPLTKVTLALEVNSDNTDSSPPSDPLIFNFVCGLAIEGLTAFEKEMQGMAPGDRTRLQIESQNVNRFFEHLAHPLMALLPVEPPLELSIEVVSVEPVTDRELVKALAEKTEGSGGDCGCGCSCECG